MMYNWINIIKPEESLLKIRMPYCTDDKNIDKSIYNDEFKYSKKLGIDFMDNYKNNTFYMCKSQLYVQAWAGSSSSEIRMLINKKNIKKIIKYDVKKIEGQLFYFNNMCRSWFMHNNANANKKYNLCYCNDCALENLIWTNYFKKFSGFGIINNVYDAIDMINKITFRPLYKLHTGTTWCDFSKNLDIFKQTIEEHFKIKELESYNYISNIHKKYTKKLGDSGK